MKKKDRWDSSGIRFYLSNELRPHDLGYLTFGTLSSPVALVIPPKIERFIVDSYCPSTITKVDGSIYFQIDSFSSLEFSSIRFNSFCCFSSYTFARYIFQLFEEIDLLLYIGVSMWTKIIRNGKAIEYLFNAESYQFNYQFENRLPKTIKIYPVNIQEFSSIIHLFSIK